MMRIVALCLLVAIAVTGWIGFDQHRRAMAQQAEAEAALASASAALAIAQAQARITLSSSHGEGTVPAQSALPMPSLPAAPVFAGDQVSTGFSCDGRTHCSQMHSCAEAKYFLRHCPGVKMDGDHDGAPCEQQFSECGS